MSDFTHIQWTDATWNPTRGCSPVSKGCGHCYAEDIAARFVGEGLPYEGLTTNGHWNGKIKLAPEHTFLAPLRWTRPRKIFVDSMSDLFHENISFELIALIFGIMAAAKQHTFQILTKRPKRALAWFAWMEAYAYDKGLGSGPTFKMSDALARAPFNYPRPLELQPEWPLPNVWVGVSVENQETANERIPLLLKIPAAIRFVSAEPLLGPVDLTAVDEHFHGNRLEYLNAITGKRYFVGEELRATKEQMTPYCETYTRGIDWVIPGGESGPDARECWLEWVRALVSSTAGTATACFVKQLGSNCTVWSSAMDARVNWTQIIDFDGKGHKKGGEITQWPEDIRVREFPHEVVAETSAQQV